MDIEEYNFRVELEDRINLLTSTYNSEVHRDMRRKRDLQSNIHDDEYDFLTGIFGYIFHTHDFNKHIEMTIPKETEKNKSLCKIMKYMGFKEAVK